MASCALMIYVSAGVFAVLYVVLLGIVAVLYCKYRSELKDQS